MAVLASLHDWWERRRVALQCRQAVELVTDYLDGALAADEHQAFEDHLAHCEACSAYLAQMRATVAVLGRLEPPPVDEHLRDDLVTLFRNVRGR